ncbi:MAG TPA: protein kinase [Thermoanaerobaculia bacterium]|nr:protein kinase [Thermoanaerobaculia bacterium]
MTIPSGTRLGPYEITAQAGAGGMGEVYKARDTRLDRTVAIKILPAELATNTSLRLRFEREAKTISQLNHPNICTLYDVGETRLEEARDERREASEESEAGVPLASHLAPLVSYLVMEYLEGETLGDRLAKGPLPIGEALRIGVQVADALDRAHRQGVIHRDLKPGNVMLTKSGAKLLDFGLARTLADAGGGRGRIDVSLQEGATEHRPQHPLTQEGTILGTFQYMAPEQLEGSEADARTDIFAFGCLLYEMATGHRAFEGKTRTSLIAAIVTGQPRPLSELQPSSPPALEHVIARCLEKEPDDRWQSVHDVASELRWISETGSATGVAAPVVPTRRRRERFAWAAVTLAVLLAIAIGSVAFLRRPEPSRVIRFEINPPPETAFFPFDELGMAISPDGRSIALATISRDGKQRLFLRAIDAIDAAALPETTGAAYPFWSPDGRFIAFFADGKLKKVARDGGPPLVIADAASGRGGVWGTDGTILFAPNIYSGIHRVSANGGTSEAITQLDPATDVSHRWPHLLPDGKHFVFLLRSQRDGGRQPGRLMLASLDGKEQRPLLENASNAIYAGGHLFFGRDGSLMAQRFDLRGLEMLGDPVTVVPMKLSYWEPKNLISFSVSDKGLLVYLPTRSVSEELRILDRSGRQADRIGTQGNFDAGSAFSPDGKRVVFSRGEDQRQNDVWFYDRERKRVSRMTFEPGEYWSLSWTPDGSTLYFTSQPKGVPQIYRRSLTVAGGTELVFENNVWKWMGGFAPDGKHFMVSEQSPDGGMDLWLHRTDSDERTLFLKTPSNEIDARFSPDGKWVAYTSDETGVPEVYVRHIANPADQWQVSSGGGMVARWRADGRELFYITPDGTVMAVTVQTGDRFEPSEPVRLFDIEARGEIFRPSLHDVSPGGDLFLVLTPGKGTTVPAIQALSDWRSAVEPDARGR